MSNYHTPVLLQEVIQNLAVTTGKRIIDATVGGGGHTKAMVDLGAEVFGIDQDEDAIEETKKLCGPTCRIVQGNFRNIEKIAKDNGITEVDGVLFDLGVSSHQVDEVSRGFTYRFDEAPLDMRLGKSASITAEQVINTYDKNRLFNIFAKYGEEERAIDIASEIVHTRTKTPITNAGLLREVICSAIGREDRDTIARIFQAVRMEVNDELAALHEGLTGAAHLVRSKGRIAVISFHSLEDRVVKQFFQNPMFVEVTKKPLRATFDEQMRNKRSRSAKLRVVEKR